MNRIIMHIDMNSYFASVEQQANPFLREKPIVVTGKRFDVNQSDKAQRSIVAAASREAKLRGVKTAMSTWEAKKLCPELIIVPGDPEKYSEITRRFFKIFNEFTDRVEQFSVDEGFLDVTDIARDYLDATAVALMIKKRLQQECGKNITASIGIAPNKLMAKLASESEKPNGLVVIRQDEILDFLEKTKLDDICGIGPRILMRLNNMGIYSIKEMQKCQIQDLLTEFKSYGVFLHNAAFGKDDEPVVANVGHNSVENEPKSVGHSYTMPRDIYDPIEMQKQLLMLADKVAWRLRRDGFVSKEVHVSIKYSDLSYDGASKRITENINDGLKLFKIAWGMIENFRDNKKSVRFLGISAGAISKGCESSSLFYKERKLSLLQDALDNLQFKFGANVWKRASTVKCFLAPRSSGWHYDHEI